MPKADWTRNALEKRGFTGWVTFADLGAGPEQVPREGGVYVVVQGEGSKPDYLDANPGGRFKGKDPTVEQAALEANWVKGAEVVYIGKADELRRRLRQFQRFGDGDPIGHWGGRLIWQLAHSRKLLVAWRTTPGQVPREVEVDMIETFRRDWGKPPFANDPHRLGV
jgi:hypothetical protein